MACLAIPLEEPEESPWPHATLTRQALNHVRIVIVPQDENVGAPPYGGDQAKWILSRQHHRHILVG